MDLKGRLEILKSPRSEQKLDITVSLEAIARRTPGFTGADFSQPVKRSAILTARRRKDAITLRKLMMLLTVWLEWKAHHW